jgi:hypothetical protein
MQPAPLDLGHVPQGPRAYRARLRRLGPIAGLIPPAALGALAWLLLRNNTSALRGVGSFVLGVLAAPALLVAGVPLASGGAFAVGIAGSVALWLLVGVLAARRATRTPAASWRDFWREYLWLAGAVWLGTIGALVVANLILGRSLL